MLAYHSLEDRLVKQLFALGAADTAPRDLPVVPEEYAPELRLLTRGADRPRAEEVATNPRAASARLRAAERIADHPARAGTVQRRTRHGGSPTASQPGRPQQGHPQQGRPQRPTSDPTRRRQMETGQ